MSPEGWAPVRLGDIAHVIHGFAFSGMTAECPPPNPIVIGIGNFDYSGGFRFSSTTVKRFTGEYPSEYELSPGDLLLAMTCQTSGGEILGIPGRVPDDSETYLHNQRLGRVEVTEAESVDQGFLFQLARWTEFNRHLVATASGSKILHTSPGRIEDFEFALPPLAEQQAIAATLGALDDKIESNKCAIDREFSLAQCMLSRGDRRVRVGDVASVSKGLSYKGSGLDDGSSADARQMLNLANFTTSGQMKREGLKHYTGKYKAEHVLKALDLLIANTDLTQSREILGRGFLVPPSAAGAIHTHHTSVVRMEDTSLVLFLWAQLQTTEFRDRAQGFATGTTVTALPKEALLDFELQIPLEPERRLRSAMPLLRHAWHLSDESTAIAAIRDALLPGLLSGRVRSRGPHADTEHLEFSKGTD